LSACPNRMVFIAVIEVLGVFSYIFVVGRLERVPE
jgi:hypothetical protein